MIFGEKIFYEDPILGRLNTTIRSIDPQKKRSWMGFKKLPTPEDSTFFAFEGDINGPFKKQVEKAHQIIELIDSTKVIMDTELKKTQRNYSKIENWQEYFHLTTLLSLYGEDNSFEITFGPPEVDYLEYSVGCSWINDEIIEVKAYGI